MRTHHVCSTWPEQDRRMVSRCNAPRPAPATSQLPTHHSGSHTESQRWHTHLREHGEGCVGHKARALHTGPTKDATATTRGSARRLTNTNKSVTGTAEFAAHDKGMHVRYTSPTPVFLGTTASTITHQPSSTQFCCRLHHVECPTIHGMCHQRQRWYYPRHLALARQGALVVTARRRFA